MSDQNFQEIQLSGKQLFFLFMCAVVLAVVIFLFGVSVGRGVRGPASQNVQGTAPTDTVVPTDAPPPTQPKPNELSYAQALEGRGANPAAVAPPTPATEEPPPAGAGNAVRAAGADPPKSAAPEPPKPVTEPVKQTPEPPKNAPLAARPPARAPTSLGGFVVQVESFGTGDVAAREVTKLQRKGYPAFMFTEPENTPGPRFKVRVGPYSDRAEADQIRKSLTKEGYTPFIRR